MASEKPHLIEHSKLSISRQNSEEDSYHDQNLSFAHINPVSVRVRDLSVSAKSSSLRGIFKRKRHDPEADPQTIKTVLHTTSFDLPKGSLMAIIGGSGSGKTTLLNVLADRTGVSSTLSKTGDVLYNGGSLESVRNAYVLQQDVLSPNLTCRETLQYAAELRLPDSTTHEERSRLVEEIIMELGLKDCAGTIVGDSTHKGLSGGEKRRVSIGIQMLSNPSLLFLDEPTTGLDAHSAFLLIRTLKGLAKRGRTIIISIHQPRSDIFFLFDYLCILSKGRTVYSHRVDKVLPYFEQFGFHVPDSVNPADYLVDITAVDVRTPESESQGMERLLKLSNHWSTYSQTLLDTTPITPTKHQKVVQKRAPFLRELTILTKRTYILTIRDTSTLLSLFGESIFMGIICGWVYYSPSGSLSGIRTLAGAIYSSCALQGYLMLLFETFRLCHRDIKTFDRERSDNCTSPLGFLLSRRLAKLFTEDVIVTLLYSIITYFMYGLQRTARKFFIYWIMVFLTHLTSMTGAMFAVSLTRNYAEASLVANLNYTVQSFACGFFANANTMPVYVRWTKYVAYMWYSFGCGMVNQFEDYMGDCPYEGEAACYSFSGEAILKEYGFWRSHWITICLFVVLAWSFFFYSIAGLLLKYKTVDVTLSKQVKEAGASENELKNERPVNPSKSQTPDEIGQIDVTLNDFYLGVKVRRGKQEKVILSGINATFKAGKLNAIMGPSGSGKSSLLNLVSGRLSSNLMNRYSSSGDIFFNNIKVSSEMMNQVCSYVSQDDDHLLDTLSVRETLQMAANLRLRNMTSSQRKQAVDDIIAQLGLRGCANTMIGSEFIKGISGGEKRRVSIGIQLLNNPKILFLDEPTSGLDAFTAATILEILQRLADEGKTIIMTIHQPRSDLFTEFGQVLLLSKGGHVAFNGAQSDIVPYFEGLGYPCPKLTNSADHILDLISVNYQSTKVEQEIKARINTLLTHWSTQPRYRPESPEVITEKEFKQRFASIIREPCGFVVALTECTRQFAITTLRNLSVVGAKLFNPLGVGIVVALYMAPLKNNYAGIQTRLGAIQQTTALYFCGMLNNLASYPSQRNYFYHEHHDRVYSTLPFFLSYTLVEIPFDILASLIVACFFGPIIGLPRTAEMYFAIAYTSLMTIFCGESLGIITNTLFDEAGFAVNSVSVILSIGTFMAGVMSLQMNGFLKGVNYMSPLKYMTTILLNMGFPDDMVFTCDNTTRDANGNCLLGTGRAVLETYGLRQEYKSYFGILVCIAVIYRVIAYFLLRLKMLKIDIGVFRTTKVE
ncbi:CYFA0S01e01332g1_1 [Cyberlindnera fabianii]|uniref:CYFA0S01e01332g1_1 n=1 Tax=Cyberlindnera fabianii TaxID=36022 RepID=A0A061AH51_CYBFA|nr:CYFA0S01e01332g1_1 [Cyberlindnera fabianii]